MLIAIGILIGVALGLAVGATVGSRILMGRRVVAARQET